MSKKIDEVLTVSEAAEMWGLAVNTIKCSCTGQKGLPPRFTEDECRKSKGTWLVTKEGMQRLYGPAKC